MDYKEALNYIRNEAKVAHKIKFIKEFG